MSKEPRNKPVIMVVGADGAHVIDGVHRLRRRIQDGCSDVKVFLMQSGILRAMRIRLLRQQADGSWKQDRGISGEDLDREISAGDEMGKQIIRPL